VAATKPGTRIEYDMDAAIESPLSIPASAYTPNRSRYLHRRCSGRGTGVVCGRVRGICETTTNCGCAR
jgi:hypothetical protein